MQRAVESEEGHDVIFDRDVLATTHREMLQRFQARLKHLIDQGDTGYRGIA